MSVKLTVITIGSRGDVQPYVALGRGLKAAGYQVCLATHEEFRPFVEENGLAFRPVLGNPRQMLESEAGQAWLESGRNPVSFVRRFFRLVGPLYEQMLASIWACCQEGDAILYSLLSISAYFAAEKLRKPALGAFLQPFHPTDAFPNVAFPLHRPAGSWLNRLSHQLFYQALWQPSRPVVNRWLQEMVGLPPASFWGPMREMLARKAPALYGYSPVVLPHPADWGDHLAVTGYWFLERPAGWQPPAELAAFLEAGPPPVYIGFGSMKNREPEEATRLVLAALERSGQRGVLLTGWGGLRPGDLPETVFKTSGVPHDWLFPQMAALVHHGGAGTTAAGLRSGRPAVVVPFFGDQIFWGQRVYRLGAGPRPITRRRLTAGSLADAIEQAVGSATMHWQATEIGRQIRAESGVARAVEVVARYL